MDWAAREEFHSQMFAAQVRKLLLDAHFLRQRSRDLHAQAALIVRRNRVRVAQTRQLLAVQAQRRAARLLQELIVEKLDAGRLPEASAPIIHGAPGIGGCCDACEKPLLARQLVMSVPWPSRETFARLHADCFMAWNAVRCSRAALAHPA